MEEVDQCMVCGLSTVDENGDALPNVLLCGDGEGRGCDIECHLECSGLVKVPAGDWFCGGCTKKQKGVIKKGIGSIAVVR